MRKAVTAASFKKRYGDVFEGDTHWKKIKAGKGQTFSWPMSSTYVKRPPYFDGMTMEPAPTTDIRGARILALFGDSITTDHISPAGSIKATSPAGLWLTEHQVRQQDFNSYGSRRGNDEVMVRGTFANIRIRNEVFGGKEGGNALHFDEAHPGGEEMSIYDAAMKYMAEEVPTVIVAGKEYGTGSSRDWAAKGTKLLGIRAVIAESFERIHRSNLVGMGVAPFVFTEGKTRHDYKLTGREAIDILGLVGGIGPRMQVVANVHYPDGTIGQMPLWLRIDTADEISYYRPRRHPALRPAQPGKGGGLGSSKELWKRRRRVAGAVAQLSPSPNALESLGVARKIHRNWRTGLRPRPRRYTIVRCNGGSSRSEWWGRAWRPIKASCRCLNAPSVPLPPGCWALLCSPRRRPSPGRSGPWWWSSTPARAPAPARRRTRCSASFPTTATSSP